MIGSSKSIFLENLNFSVEMFVPDEHHDAAANTAQQTTDDNTEQIIEKYRSLVSIAEPFPHFKSGNSSNIRQFFSLFLYRFDHVQCTKANTKIAKVSEGGSINISYMVKHSAVINGMRIITIVSDGDG